MVPEISPMKLGFIVSSRISSAYFIVESAICAVCAAARSASDWPPELPPLPPVPPEPPDESPLLPVRLPTGAPLSPPMKMSMETMVPSSSSSIYCSGILICVEMAPLST